MISVWLLFACAASAAPEAAIHAEIGYTRLRAEVGDARIFGAGIAVAQVESSQGVDTDGDPATPSVATWMPKVAARALRGQTIVDRTGAPPGIWSGHATSVARRIVGRRAMADTVETLDVYSVADWIGAGHLRVGTRQPPAARPYRVINHSWAGAGRNTNVLRRADWLTDRDEIVSVVGVRNAAGRLNDALLAASMNAIVVGRSDGRHSIGAPALDGVYTAASIRPHLVAPLPTGSAAAATVTSAVIVLLDAAGDAALSQRQKPIRSRGGALVRDAGRPEVIRAVLMAGADRRSFEAPAGKTAGRAANGLDRRVGAGQLDIEQAWQILTAGEQEEAVGVRGFDYVPAAAGSSLRKRYVLPPVEAPARLAATLSWHLAFPGGNAERFDASATVYDLDLSLLAIGDDEERVVASSRGRADTTENVDLRLEPGVRYVMEVSRRDGQPLQCDFALAWRIAS